MCVFLWSWGGQTLWPTRHAKLMTRSYEISKPITRNPSWLWIMGSNSRIQSSQNRTCTGYTVPPPQPVAQPLAKPRSMFRSLSSRVEALHAGVMGTVCVVKTGLIMFNLVYTMGGPSSIRSFIGYISPMSTMWQPWWLDIISRPTQPANPA